MDLDLSIETLMMIFFVLALVFSSWKFYAFMPTKKLEDDDTDTRSKLELEHLMLAAIIKAYDADEKKMLHKLFEAIQADTNFDKEHYWRFNTNRLNQLIQAYLLNHPNCHTLHDIYHQEAQIDTP